MGNWRTRPRFYRRRSPQRSWYDDRRSSSYGDGEDDGFPAWEKKFCEVIGSVPWQKVVEAKYFMSWYQGNVISWNDSACEEAFHNAKSRFWSEINHLPCHIALPDPDMFIDDIDWEPVIDPELILDLERAYFAAPDKGQSDAKPWPQDKNVNATVLLSNPLESSDRAHGLDSSRKKTGWDLSERDTDADFKDSINSLNPWDPKPSCIKETAKDAAWGVCSGSGNGGETEGWGNNTWEDKSRHQHKKSRIWKSEEYEMPRNGWGTEATKNTECDYGWKKKGWGGRKNKGRGNRGYDINGQNRGGSKGKISMWL